ncbi:MAG TPA: sensor histidine kinase, partial [Candidatus Pelethocola excrementipullorum]|nr:sensor histidine kinase [Candidatus Pelethocola excrementipullorum]
MIKKIKGSLFAKVFIVTTLLIFCVSLLIFGILAFVMPKTYSNELNSTLDKQMKRFVSEVEQVTLDNSKKLFDQLAQSSNIDSIELYSGDGRLISTPSEQREAESVEGAEGSVMYGGEVPVLSGTYYISFSDSSERYTLIVYGEAAQIEELRQAFSQVFPILFALSLLIAFTASGLYSHIITKPVLKISGIAKEMSVLKLEWRMEENRSDELGVLERSLNTLSRELTSTLSDLQNANAKLAEDIEREKELEQARLDFFSAASHELKTPITIVKGQLEGMLLGVGVYKDREKYLARSLEVADTLETMVQEILTISRLETSKAVFKPEHINLVPLIQEYLNETEDLVIQKELQIQLDIPESAYIDGNRLLMGTVFSNLIGNAVKYSPQRALIHIELRPNDGHWTFSIENRGTFIPEGAFSK